MKWPAPLRTRYTTDMDQRPSYPGIQRPGNPVDPVTLFYNELQMSTVVISAFQRYVLHFGHFFENRKNSGLKPGQNDDPVTR